MAKKSWVIISVLVLVLIIFFISNWNVFFHPANLTVAEKQKVISFKDSLSQKGQQNLSSNDWPFVMSVIAGDSLNVIRVDYQEKYGSEKSVYCMAIFENLKTGEYKCTAPWLSNLILQKSNLVSFEMGTVPKEEMKKN